MKTDKQNKQDKQRKEEEKIAEEMFKKTRLAVG
jgi:hypothetical protein